MINKKEEIKPKDSGEVLNMMHQMHGMLLSLCLNMKVKNSPKKLEVIYFTMEKKLLKVILETKNKMINKKRRNKAKGFWGDAWKAIKPMAEHEGEKLAKKAGGDLVNYGEHALENLIRNKE